MNEIKAEWNGLEDWTITVNKRFRIEIKAEIYAQAGKLNVFMISKFSDINTDRIKSAIMECVNENQNQFDELFESVQNEHRYQNGLIDNY